MFEELEDQEGGWWSRRGKESGRREIREDFYQGGCVEPCNAWVKILGLTLSEMRVYQKVLNREVIWSDSDVKRFTLSAPCFLF